LPVLSEVRELCLEALASGDSERALVAIQANPVVAFACISTAGRAGVRPESLRAALEGCGQAALSRAIAQQPTFSLGTIGRLQSISLAQRHHGRATARLGAVIAEALGLACERREALATACVLHDFGRALMMARSGADAYEHCTPERRVQLESEAHRYDHAQLGGLVLRRVGAGPGLCQAVADHHAEEPEGLAAIVSMADMCVHLEQGRPVRMEAIHRRAEDIGLGYSALALLLAGGFQGPSGAMPTPTISPLSGREQLALEAAAQGRSYAELGREHGLAATTVPAHARSAYAKVGAATREEAVVAASRLGLISTQTGER